MHYSKNISWCVTEMLKYVPLVKQNVMKFEVFILGGQRIDQKRKNAWWRGRRERIEKASRERIEIWIIGVFASTGAIIFGKKSVATNLR